MFNHLSNVCMNYNEHFFLSIQLCVYFLVGGICAFVHAFIPDLFTSSSSYYSNIIVDKIQKSGCNKDD